MKIIALQAENVKKLTCIEIKPDGNLVQITGKNGQGKTSVLDSIWWALCGAANIQGNPIRKGENQAKIMLDLGEIVVTRIFKKIEGGTTTSSLTIENAEGTVIRSPQTMLDKLIGELSFDPLAFSRMTKKEQFDQLRRFVPDVNFEEIEKEHQEDYDKRTNINRQAKDSRTLAENIFVPEGIGQPIDESALVDELEAAGRHNADIETRKANRERMANDIKNKQDEEKRLLKRAEELRAESERVLAEADKAANEAVQMEKRLKEAPALPEPKNLSIIRNKITEARAINMKVEQAGKKAGYIIEAEKFEAESEEITGRINQRQSEKMDKIAAAKLPIDGLGFGDNEILLRGIPFNQASDAEQLQVSIAMAMTLNPKLRVIRVRDGSLLDEDSLKLLEKMAVDQDYQVWLEKVDSTGKVGFVLEDGHIKKGA